MAEKIYGIDELRAAVDLFNACNEHFAIPCRGPGFTAEQLVAIYRAHVKSGWDIYPDEWTPRQVKEALKGIVPRWTADEKPDYSTPKKAG